ncbi:MAG: cupredoxin domain-containing protein [Actinomycetota bacterium]|nr:cupredoxin domain-containing protein [Actinomycetota bacterium]
MGSPWRALLRWAAVFEILLVIAANIVFGFFPPVVVIGLLIVVGLAFLHRTWGLWLAGIGSLLLFLMVVVMFQIWRQLRYFEDTISFSLAAVATLSTVIALVAFVATLATRRRTVSAALPTTLGVLALAALVAGVAYSAVQARGLEQEAPRPGDIMVATAEFEFRPRDIQASAGTVSVHVTNQDRELHTFTVPELGVNLIMPGGTQRRISFEAQPKTYQVICEPHAPDMAGTLVVR